MPSSRLPQILTAGALVLIAAILHRRSRQHSHRAPSLTPDHVTVRQCDSCGTFSWPGAIQCTHCGATIGANHAA